MNKEALRTKAETVYWMDGSRSDEQEVTLIEYALRQVWNEAVGVSAREVEVKWGAPIIAAAIRRRLRIEDEGHD